MLNSEVEQLINSEGTITNPVLDIAKIIIFPVFEKLEIKRPEKFGGNKSYNSYHELEKRWSDNHENYNVIWWTELAPFPF